MKVIAWNMRARRYLKAALERRVRRPALSESVRAPIEQAFTTGHEIFFRQGEYCSMSTEGQKLFAHVVQQGGGTV